MYEQVEKPKENTVSANRRKNRAGANNVSQKKSREKLEVGFVDNRPSAIAQKKLLRGSASQTIQYAQDNSIDSNSNLIQLWSVRYQNLDTGATVFAENSLKALPNEALQDISENGFENVQLVGEDADPRLLQDMAKGMLEARRMERFREPNTQHRNPSGRELDNVVEQIQLPASFGGLAAEDSSLTGIRARFARFMQDATNVSLSRNGIDVFLDIDQLKHQPQQHPIGTRQAGGGNRFKPPAGSVTWHQANTLVHMRDWAESLPESRIGEQKYHGQARPVNGIHYEGYCVMLPDRKKSYYFIVTHRIVRT